MKKKYEISIIAITIFFVLIFIVPFGYIFASDIYYNTAGREALVEYNNDDYYYANVVIGSGTTENFYFGAVTKEDYNKWRRGEHGTVWVNTLLKENYGHRINIDNITSISLFDKENDWLQVS